MMKLSQINLYDPGTTSGGLQGFGPLGLENTSAVDAPNTFANLLSKTIGIITIIGIIWMVINIISGSVGIITSGGDKNSLESAKKKITNSVIGLIVLITSLFIINIAGRFLGIPAILDLSRFINLL